MAHQDRLNQGKHMFLLYFTTQTRGDMTHTHFLNLYSRCTNLCTHTACERYGHICCHRQTEWN